MKYLLLAFDSGTYILFTVLMIIALGLICFVMFIRIRQDSKKYSLKGDDKGVMSAENFKRSVDRTLMSASARTKFYCFQIDIRDFDELKKSIGVEQFASIVKEQCSILSKLQPFGVKIGLKRQDSIMVMVKAYDQNDLENMCKLIISSLAKEYALSENMTVNIEVNVAAALYPEAGANFDELNKNMGISMVVSRRKGENRYALYSPQLGNSETEEYKYYQEIREAIKAKEFALYYQPIVETNSLEVSGAETLMRWIHKSKGILRPSEFLYVMEQTGDINWVGFWCFERMVAQYIQWNANYEQKFDLSFNLSERQLLNPELADQMKAIVKKFKISPNSFVVEISDMLLYNTSDIVKKNLDALYKFGFKVCLDGFGTKFTSPTALENLPISSIKIDKEFWVRVENSTMIANIIEMLIQFAAEKTLLIIATGVENREEIDLLRKHGINYMQGYVFNKPKDAKDFIGDVVFTPWAEDLKINK